MDNRKNPWVHRVQHFVLDATALLQLERRETICLSRQHRSDIRHPFRLILTALRVDGQVNTPEVLQIIPQLQQRLKDLDGPGSRFTIEQRREMERLLTMGLYYIQDSQLTLDQLVYFANHQWNGR